MRKQRLHVAVIMGGPSAERDISIQSGQTMARHLRSSKYIVVPIVITNDRKWLKVPNLLRNSSQRQTQAIIPAHEHAAGRLDVALLALHSFGEDGSVQGFLETLDIPYTGSNILASALAMDKDRFKTFCRSLKLTMPASILIHRHLWRTKQSSILQSLARLGQKIVVKPNASGSSAGISIVNTHQRLFLKKAIETALETDPRGVLAESYIRGRELTVATLGHARKVRALPIIEIVPTQDTYFSYKVKYDGSTKEICPAPIPQSLARQLSDIAIAVHQAIGASGVIRTDFIVRRGVPYLLETNTLPGMTQESLVPKAAAVASITYENLLDELIRLALNRKHE